MDNIASQTPKLPKPSEPYKNLSLYDLVSDKDISREKIDFLRNLASDYEKNSEHINAWDLYKQLADNHDDPVSQQCVGSMLLAGKGGISQHFYLGITYLVKAAKQGDEAAINELGNINYEVSSEEDKPLITFLSMMASWGDTEAAIASGEWFVGKSDKTPVIQYLSTVIQNAVIQKDSAGAAIVLGEWYVSSKDKKWSDTVISSLTAVVVTDEAKINYLLGRVFLTTGAGGKAIHHLQLASEHGSTDAMCLMGKIYGWEFCFPSYRPIPVNEAVTSRAAAIDKTIAKVTAEQTEANKKKWGLSTRIHLPDWEKASAYFTKAAQGGNPEAMYLLGSGLLNNKSESEIDFSGEEAWIWIEKAARQGFPEAVCLLGWNNEDKLAWELINIAAHQGLPEAAWLIDENELALQHLAKLALRLSELTWLVGGNNELQKESLPGTTKKRSDEAEIYYLCRNFGLQEAYHYEQANAFIDEFLKCENFHAKFHHEFLFLLAHVASTVNRPREAISLLIKASRAGNVNATLRLARDAFNKGEDEAEEFFKLSLTQAESEKNEIKSRIAAIPAQGVRSIFLLKDHEKSLLEKASAARDIDATLRLAQDARGRGDHQVAEEYIERSLRQADQIPDEIKKRIAAIRAERASSEVSLLDKLSAVLFPPPTTPQVFDEGNNDL